MIITKRRLRHIIRETLILEEELKQASEDAAHKHLESQPVNDENLMTKGDPAYTAFIKDHPAAKSGIDSIFASFEVSRKNRLEYLNQNFTQRYMALQKKLNKKDDVDVEKLKQAMIDHVENTKLKMGTYGTNIIANYSDNKYNPLNDSTSGWLNNLSSTGFANKTNIEGYHVIAYATRDEPLVVSEPPDLKINSAGKVEAAIPSPNIQSTLEHELIHQEDYAAEKLLGMPSLRSSEKSDTSVVGSAAVFAKNLIKQAMVSRDQLTLDFIYKRLVDHVVLLESAFAIGYDCKFNFDDDSLIFPTSAAIIADYAYELNYYPDPYWIFYDATVRSAPFTSPRIDVENINTESAEADRIRKVTSQRHGEAGVLLKALISDYQIETHMRITLLLLLPHLQKALAKNKDSKEAINSALSAMKAANSGDDLNRAALILAITDPTKLVDLTLVAMGDTKKKPTQVGSETTQSALAERWGQLAGLLKG